MDQPKGRPEKASFWFGLSNAGSTARGNRLALRLPLGHPAGHAGDPGIPRLLENIPPLRTAVSSPAHHDHLLVFGYFAEVVLFDLTER